MDEWLKREEWVRQRAVVLTPDAHPAYNLAPLMDLLRQAYDMGFDVVEREAPMEPITETREQLQDRWCWIPKRRARR